METFTWRVTRQDGTFDAPCSVTVCDEDGELLRSWWDDIERTPPGEKRSELIRVLRTHMDLFACFPGVHEKPSESDAEPLPPPYLLHTPMEEPEELSEAPALSDDFGAPALFDDPVPA